MEGNSFSVDVIIKLLRWFMFQNNWQTQLEFPIVQDVESVDSFEDVSVGYGFMIKDFLSC